MSALLDSSKLLLNIFTSFHSERAVNHDRLQAMQSCIFTIRPIAPLSTKLNSFNCTSSQNAIPLKGHSPLPYAIPANYCLLTSLKLQSPPSLYAGTLDWLSRCSLAHLKARSMRKALVTNYRGNLRRVIPMCHSMVFLNHLSTATGQQHPVAY